MTSEGTHRKPRAHSEHSAHVQNTMAVLATRTLCVVFQPISGLAYHKHIFKPSTIISDLKNLKFLLVFINPKAIHDTTLIQFSFEQRNLRFIDLRIYKHVPGSYYIF